ncbi:MAG TPA: alpha/beta fold hydrolase [Solirubrobacteraceae bacterium]
MIFLHGWGPTTPFFYKAWMSHLVDEGVTVIFPAYQGTALATLPKNVEVSVRAALKRLSVAPSSVVLAGHTSGATLAIDYATSAAAAGLPSACAVYGVFPGVSLSATANIPLSEPAKLPAASRLVLVAGPSDPIPGGTNLAQAIIADARQIPRSRRSLLNAPGDNPGGPVEQTTASQRTFWRPLDRLIADCGKRLSAGG